MLEYIFRLYSESIIATSLFILCAIFIHYIFRKRPSSQLYLIWFFVLIRLLFPFSLKHELNFGAYTIPQEVINTIPVSIDSVASDTNVTIGAEKDETNIKTAAANKTNYEFIIRFVWFLGTACFIANYLLRMLVLKMKAKRSIQIAEYKNVWRWNDSTGACVIGIFRPQIYVPLDCEGEKLDFIIRHESQHIKHFDYLFVALYYFVLTLHWYNPLAWISYKMAIQDIEKSCDECVLLHSTVEERQAYARNLLDFYKKKSGQPVTVGFGKSNIKKRIKNIMENKKKKRFYTILIVTLCIVLLGVCALFHIETGHQKNVDLTKLADTIGKEDIGVTAPNIIYADDDKCIFYDYHGVFVYEFSKKQLSDYIEFQELGFSARVQGDDATFAFSQNQGRKVYITNYTQSYIYDCEKQNGELKNYHPDDIPEDSIDSLQSLDESEQNVISEIYVPEKDTKLYWIYEGNTGKYSELRLLLDKNGDIEEYLVFKK